MNGAAESARKHRPSNTKQFTKADIIALAGDFGESRSHEALRRWIKCAGGKFTSKFDKNTTHLVVSLAAWKSKVTLVQQALQDPDIHIVTYDWLEDSIITEQRKPEAAYHPQTVIRKREKARRRDRKDRKAAYKFSMEDAKGDFAGGSNYAWQDLGSENWHTYRDSSSFLYSIELHRPCMNGKQTFRLSIYESNDGPPFTYTTAVRYAGPIPTPDHTPKGIGLFYKKDSKGYKTVETSRILSPLGCSFAYAYDTFRRFFELQTGVLWEYRAWGKDKFTQGRKGALERQTIAKSLDVIGPNGEGGALNIAFSSQNESMPLVKSSMKTSRKTKGDKEKLSRVNRPDMLSNLLLRSTNPIAPNIDVIPNPEQRFSTTQLQTSHFLGSYSRPAQPPDISSPYLEASEQDLTDKRYFIYALPPSSAPHGVMPYLPRAIGELGWPGLWTALAEEEKTAWEEHQEKNHNNGKATSLVVKVGGKQITSTDGQTVNLELDRLKRNETSGIMWL